MVRGHLVAEAARKVLGQILSGCDGGSSRRIVTGQQMGGGLRGRGMGVGTDMGHGRLSTAADALMMRQWQRCDGLLMMRMLVEMRMMLLVVRLLLLRMLVVLLRLVLLLMVVRGLRCMLCGVMISRGCWCNMLICRAGSWRWQRGAGRGRQCCWRRMTMAIAGLRTKLCAMVVRVMSRYSRCGRSALQLGAIQIEYVGDMKAGTLRRGHLGIKEAARARESGERERG